MDGTVPSRGRAAAVLAVLAVGCLVAACSSAKSSSPTTSTTRTSPRTSTTTPTPTTGSPSAPTTSTTTPAAPTTTHVGPTACTESDFRAALSGSSGAAGTIEATFSLTATASASCVLGGYPGMLLLGAGGAALPTTVVRKGTYGFTAMAPTTVTVVPGQQLFFNVGYSDVPVGDETSCPTSTSLEITPPGSYGHLTIPARLDPCGNGTLTVSPVFPSSSSATQSTAPAS